MSNLCHRQHTIELGLCNFSAKFVNGLLFRELPLLYSSNYYALSTTIEVYASCLKKLYSKAVEWQLPITQALCTTNAFGHN